MPLGSLLQMTVSEAVLSKIVGTKAECVTLLNLVSFNIVVQYSVFLIAKNNNVIAFNCKCYDKGSNFP